MSIVDLTPRAQDFPFISLSIKAWSTIHPHQKPLGSSLKCMLLDSTPDLLSQDPRKMQVEN